MKRPSLSRFIPYFTKEEKVCLTIMALLVIGLSVASLYQAITHQVIAYGAPLAGKAEAAELPVDIDALLQAIADCESGVRNPDGSAVPGSAKQFYKSGNVVRNDVRNSM